MKDLDINFPLEKFEKLIIDIGWESLDDWFNFWNNKRNILSIDQYWNNNVNDDWIWGLALPLLSQAYKFQNNFSDRKIIGISALPGTGKTTLGKWLEAMSLKLYFKISVISIDDFYLPSNEMKLAIKNNPWNVSRGFPGSHSVGLMYEKLLNWKKNGWKTANKKEVKNKELWTELDNLSSAFDIEWIWVKAHSTDELNNEVDLLARSSAND